MTTDMSGLATKHDLVAMKKQILDGVRVLNEELLYNFRGAFKDRTELLNDKVYAHEERIVRIEHFLRLP